MKTQTQNIDPMNLQQIYDKAVKRFESFNPRINPYAEIAERMSIAGLNMKEGTLRAKIHGDRSFTIPEEDMFFLICSFPEGYTMKQQRVFSIINPKYFKSNKSVNR